ncbi:carboxypeptidase M32 [Salinibius halmophilus]|uniref:carboxypeptidase M32 n=1 Tax=Salinibius halmophilus TaxID=1853216 RepID=UPI0018F4F7F7|nr:carboxypeptidase M32 [Salinibius halmophilus]
MSYQQLTDHFRSMYRLGHFGAIGHWDNAAMMPEGGATARSNALTELEGLLHQMATDPRLPGWIGAAKKENLDTHQTRNLALIERSYLAANCLDKQFVEAQMQAGMACEHAWRTQRGNNDWQGFKANFEKVVTLSREEAKRRGEATGEDPYNAMLDLYEPGLKRDAIDSIFANLKTWLPETIQQVVAKQAQETVIEPTGPFPVAKQKQLAEKVMAAMGFDFEGGRVDESAHPFCGGVPEDVRMTTRYDENDFLSGLLGIIHETGHACYEQNLPRDPEGQPINEALGMAMHEGQSLSFEMQIARTPEFCDWLAPLLNETFGAQPAFEANNLYKLFTRVAPGKIRVDADEVTYPMHVILRYEIETALIDGNIEIDDIPGLWQEKMQQYLGLDLTGDYKDGCMQDVHWTDGAFGYFPTYTLGAMTAAQLINTLRTQHPEAIDAIRLGDFTGVYAFLRERVWQHGSAKTGDQLMTNATGEPLNPEQFRQHIYKRYL